jgi:SAM-dependent methyltransferase
VLPREVLDRDYGCGDPTRHLRPGETVLDLGSGSGKACFIASQVVGPEGRVIGVDENAEMLGLSRRWRREVGRRIGWHNVVFHHARMQDLSLELDTADEWLREHPIDSLMDLRSFEAYVAQLRREQPMIESESVDVVISNCTLNLVRDGDKPAVLREVYRVLKRGGRIAISDIVSDEDPPPEMKADPTLWSGCLAGAMREDRFLGALEEAGFYGVTLERFSASAWRTVGGIQFRSATVLAHKGKEGPCKDHGEAAVYRGPFRSVIDDDGHTFRRGARTAVCRKTSEILSRSPYADHFTVLQPLVVVAPEEAPDFDCRRAAVRSPLEMKGEDHRGSSPTGSAARCETGASCC